MDDNKDEFNAWDLSHKNNLEQDVSSDPQPERRVTRSLARERNIEVTDHPLPAHCPTSKIFWQQDGS